METKHTIETIGYILKEEKIATLKHNILPNTFVVETQDSYPGYHGKDLPGELKVPEFLFFITKQKYSSEHLARVTKNIRKYFKDEIDIARAELTVYNTLLYSIRIKGIKDFTKISELQSCFKSEGIEFAKSKNVEAECLIKIQKQFILEEKSEGIFQDLEEPSLSYIQVPINLTWQQFKVITSKIKHAMDSGNFDAALGLFYKKQGLTDFVRIYDKEGNIQKMKDLHNRYSNEIKKLLLDNFV